MAAGLWVYLPGVGWGLFILRGSPWVASLFSGFILNQASLCSPPGLGLGVFLSLLSNPGICLAYEHLLWPRIALGVNGHFAACLHPVQSGGCLRLLGGWIPQWR